MGWPHITQYLWRSHSQEPWRSGNWDGLHHRHTQYVTMEGGGSQGWISNYVQGAEPKGLWDFCDPVWSRSNPWYMSQWRGGVHRDGSAIMYKGQSQRVCGTFVTQCGLDQIPGRECGGLRPPDAETKCEIRVQFLTFSCTIVWFHEYRSRAWTVFLRTYGLVPLNNSASEASNYILCRVWR